jgi:hypothetical protein
MADISYNIANKDETDMTAQTLATHLAETSAKHITESGSNANGNYIKFDDGTMLCWARVTHNYNLDTAQTYPMPMPFSASSIPFGSHSVGNAGSPAECMCNLGTVANAGYTSWTVRTIENNADRQNILNLFAVGRWK